MTPEAKKKLEEMADKWRGDHVSFTPDGPEYEDAFIVGAEAAWEMAVEQERARCHDLLIKSANHWAKVGTHPAWGGPLTEEHMNPQEYAALLIHNMANVILNPAPKEKSE